MAQAPVMVIDDASVFESNTGTTILILPVRFVGAQPATVTGTVSVIPQSGAGFSPATGGAACGGTVDFQQFANSPFTIPPNTPNGTLSVNIAVCGDSVIEPNEHVFVFLSSVVGANCQLEGTCNALGTIRNNDGPPSISINDVSASEPVLRGSTRTVAFTVSLSHPTSLNTSVNFATRNGTATSGGTFPDYQSRSGTLPIAANTLSGTINVNILGDQISESTQTFFVDLTGPVNATIADSSGQGRILDTTLSLPTGAFDLSPDDARVTEGETVPYAVVWTVPEGEVWRNLTTIDFRIRRGNNTALWLRWDEPSNAFSVCESAGNGDGGGPSSSDVTCTPGGLPGAPVVLETAFGQLHLAQSSVVGSGPTGPSVTLNLAITPGPAAVGQYRVELAASDDFGQQDEFVEAGQLYVLPVASGQ